MKKFIIQLLGLVVVAAGIMFGVHQALGVQISGWSWGALAFFAGLNILIHFLAQTALKGSQKSFITFVYGSTGLRFIFSIFFIVIYLIVSDVMDKYVVGSFLFLYLLFTSFELFHLVTKLRAEK